MRNEPTKTSHVNITQEPAIGPYHKAVHTLTAHFFKIYFNITPPEMLRSPIPHA